MKHGEITMQDSITITLRPNRFKVSRDYFHKSGLDRAVVRLERDYHPRKDHTLQVMQTLIDGFRESMDNVFPIGTGLRGVEKRAFWEDVRRRPRDLIRELAA